jgi:uncharacterized protein YbjT (DUF2867 family)
LLYATVDTKARGYMTGPEARPLTEMADRISRAVGQMVRWPSISDPAPAGTGGHGIPLEIADALDGQVGERLKAGWIAGGPFSTRLFNVDQQHSLSSRRGAEDRRGRSGLNEGPR